MAKMIPAHWLEGTPRSEQKVFQLLRDDAATSDWTILHSLNLKQTGRLPYGEIDFVVLIPGSGILCIEVKGGRVACTDGQWTSTDAADVTHPLKRSPFKQAHNGMQELRRALEERLPDLQQLRKTPFGFVVIFTDVDSLPIEIGVEPWEIIDRNGLRTPLAPQLACAAKQQRQRLHIDTALPEPQPATLKRIRDTLRPDFEKVIARSTLIHDSERRLIELTEEQYRIIDLLDGNQRCLFEGAAGTGKTLLALEFARRRASRGDKVLLICFNRFLADWFSREVSGARSGGVITCGSFYKCLRDVIVASQFAEEYGEVEKSSNNEELFGNVYPLFGQLALDASTEKFDVIVMDEAQDLLQRPILELINSWLTGGLGSGRWAFFGDFHRQAIYRTGNVIDVHRTIGSVCSTYARARLTQNCRNTKRIGEETALLSGFESPPYRMGQVDGVSVDYLDFADDQSQSIALAKVLSRLAVEPDIEAADVVILSKYRLEQSIAGKLTESSSFRIRPVGMSHSRDSQRPVFGFATAHAFKGMESKVVILCDVDRIESDDDRALLYVAMSRARSFLTVLIHARTKPAIKEAFGRRMSELWRVTP
jgi:hypothetical protein